MTWALALLVAAQPEIVGFDFEHDPETVTFVLEGTAPPSFSAHHDEEKQRIVIDWAGARLRPGVEPPLHPWLRTVRLLERRVESEPTVRIVLGLETDRSFQLRARENAIRIVFPGPPPPMPEMPRQLAVRLEVEREAAVEVPSSERGQPSTVPDFEAEEEIVDLELPPLEVSPEVQAALDRAEAAERAEAERREAARLEAERRGAERRERERREAERLARVEAEQKADEPAAAEQLGAAERVAAEGLGAAERAAAEGREAAVQTDREAEAPKRDEPLASWSPPPPRVLASTEPATTAAARTPKAEAAPRPASPEADRQDADALQTARTRPERPSLRIPPESAATMTYIGFRMRGRISRVFVRLDRDAEFGTEQSPGKLRVILPRVRVDVANNERPLDTSYFESPVTWVKASTEPGRTVVEIRLRSSVPWMTKKIGTTLAIDFVRPE